MVKVLGLVSFRVYPTHMGGQKGVALFYEHLQQYLNVRVAGSSDNVATDRIEMHRSLSPNKKIYKNLAQVGALTKYVKQNAIDIVVAEHSYTGWLAWLLRKRTGRPFVIHSHNIESRRFAKMRKPWWKLYDRYEGWIHRNADHNFFISDEDRIFAIGNFRLKADRCSVATYGIERPPTLDRNRLRKKHGIAEDKIVLLFNGTLDYEPNYDAVCCLVDIIEPLLAERLANFQIVVTGNRAPKELAEKMLTARNFLYMGYVDDVNEFYQAADAFVNPVTNNTGVKTKVIEAIANNCDTISLKEGAAGLRLDLCSSKLKLVDGGNWPAFADAIVETLKSKRTSTPEAFYDYYSWDSITKKFAQELTDLVNEKTSPR